MKHNLKRFRALMKNENGGTYHIIRWAPDLEAAILSFNATAYSFETVLEVNPYS